MWEKVEMQHSWESAINDPCELRKLAAWYREFAEQAGNPAYLGGPIEDGRSSGARGQSVGTQLEPKPSASAPSFAIVIEPYPPAQYQPRFAKANLRWMMG